MLGIAVAQVLHSLEEYRNSLWEVLAPARVASGIIGDDPALGFLIINTLVAALAFWTYFVPVSRDWPTARVFLWFWVVLELGNGIGHLALAASARGYFPGAYTAPLLLGASCYLAVGLIRGNRAPTT